MINTLQSFRGIFAILIFLSHYTLANSQRAFHPGGTMGVEYFIILSGFVMCMAHGEKIRNSRETFGRFIAGRMIRVWPVHILCLAFMVLVYAFVLNKPQSLSSLALNFALLQSWSPEQDIYYGFNTPSWCLSVFLFCYICFPLMYRMAFSIRKFLLPLTISLIGLYLASLFFWPDSVEYENAYYYSRIFPPTRLLDFMIGICLWFSLANTDRKRLRARSFAVKSAVEIFILCLFAAGTALYYIVPEYFVSAAIWWIPAVCLICWFAAVDTDGGLISRIAANRYLVKFGEISFCFYLTHYIVIHAVNEICEITGHTSALTILLPFVLALAIAIAWAVYHFFDTPISTRLRKGCE